MIDSLLIIKIVLLVFIAMYIGFMIVVITQLQRLSGILTIPFQNGMRVFALLLLLLGVSLFLLSLAIL